MVTTVLKYWRKTEIEWVPCQMLRMDKGERERESERERGERERETA